MNKKITLKYLVSNECNTSEPINFLIALGIVLLFPIWILLFVKYLLKIFLMWILK